MISRQTIDSFLDVSLPFVKQPAQYVGNEINMVVKDPRRVATRIAIGYPDTYSVGMSHQGLRILYEALNREDGIYCERFFAPWMDMEEQMRSRGAALFALETRTPLAAFGVVGFTLQYELSYVNLINCLDLGGIPVEARERTLNDPLVIAGGAGALNPEVLADFVDLFFLGDGEEAVVQFARELPEVKRRVTDRTELLLELCKRMPFLYAPALWDMEWNADGTLAKAIPLHGVTPPRRAVVLDFENAPVPTAPVLPNIETIHDRITIEIMRGCVQGCRFCQAGYEKRPQRFRSREKVLELARAIYQNTGYDEIALTSLSSSDHPDLPGIMETLDREFHDLRVGLSLPSLRVNEQVRDLPKLVRGVRKSGLTLAPEVATDRLRRRINKMISNEDLYEGAKSAWREGWKQIKLYTMIGVPGETEEDIAYIVEMAETVSKLRLQAGRRRPGIVHAAVSTFVPKPHTPFQWHGQIRPEEVRQRQEFLHRIKSMPAVKLKCHHDGRSELEGVLSRADRRVGRLLKRVHELGGRMDAWDEAFRQEVWDQAFEDTGISRAWYAHRQRDLDEVLPWDHIDGGVHKSYQRYEYEKSQRLEATEHCQDQACGDCGVGARTCVEIKGETGYWEKFAKIVQKWKAKRAQRQGATV
ncbi:MAG: TIGR03960 family B12-binding radical SAM protein [Planctomycetes bacterium]|nr:TIGR03960 family B12-binding radical SAM protein [Planctomycetota bacterium]